MSVRPQRVVLGTAEDMITNGQPASSRALPSDAVVWEKTPPAPHTDRRRDGKRPPASSPEDSQIRRRYLITPRPYCGNNSQPVTYVTPGRRS